MNQEILEIVVVLVGLFMLGHILSAVSETLYWKWIDWRNSKNKNLD